ncbi:MAG: ribosome biogenesis GTPase YlqF [Chromatiales bacterium]|nr:ribosome biogenesis GTPase YlqF [Chromatiales bacterium]
MAVNWFPGHMHKARKQIKEAMPQIDLVIEVMDARLPYSSENPLVEELRLDRPCIKILNKADLADPNTTQAWLQHFEQEKGVKAIAMSATQKGQARKILELAKRLFPDRNMALKPLCTMIMGIPNVGKSTLINSLAGKVIARVGNEPAVTKQQQKINLGNGILLFDTPGFLWPRFEDQNSGYRLAVTGAIKSTAIVFEDIALYACDYLLHAYPEALKERYKLKELPQRDFELLEEIGRKRGALRSGGKIDLHKAAEVLLQDIRSGALGRISMENPQLVAQQLAEAAAAAAAAAADEEE